MNKRIKQKSVPHKSPSTQRESKGTLRTPGKTGANFAFGCQMLRTPRKVGSARSNSKVSATLVLDKSQVRASDLNVPTISVELKPVVIPKESISEKETFIEVDGKSTASTHLTTVNSIENIKRHLNEKAVEQKSRSQEKTKRLSHMLACVNIQKKSSISKLKQEISVLSKMLKETRNDLDEAKRKLYATAQQLKSSADTNVEIAEKYKNSVRLNEIKDQNIASLNKELLSVKQKCQELVNKKGSNEGALRESNKKNYTKYLSAAPSPKRPLLKCINSPDSSIDQKLVASPQSVATPAKLVSAYANDELKAYKEYIKQLLALKGISQCLFKSLLNEDLCKEGWEGKKEEIKKWLDESIQMDFKLAKLRESEEFGLSFSMGGNMSRISIESEKKVKASLHKRQLRSSGFVENC